MEDIESGLVSLATEIRTRGIRSIAIPPLGSGLGGLEWPEVRQRMADAPQTPARFEKVSALVEGFESSFGLELLATVHWVVREEQASTLAEVVERTYMWNERKRQFTPRQLDIALNVLAEKNWIESLRSPYTL